MYTDVDSIVRGELLNQGLSIHWYMPFLNLALNCVNKLSKDHPILNNITTVRLTLGPDKAVPIPSDYIDWVKIGKQYGAYVRPLTINPSLNNLENNTSSTGAYPPNIDEEGLFGLGAGLYYFSNHITQHGEHSGGFFGFGGGVNENAFKVVPARNEIQFDPSFAEGDVIVLEYLASKASSTTAQVHIYAEEAVQAYIQWKYMVIQDRSRNSRLAAQNAKQEYYNEVRTMQARLTDWNVPDMLEAIRYHFGQAPKV
jgi:hypothetical protein